MMDNLIDEIKNHMGTLEADKAYSLKLPEAYPAYVVRTSGRRGVAVPYEGETFFARFAHISIEAMNIGQLGRVLFLYMEDALGMSEQALKFATICENFVRPGDGGANRQQLLTEPVVWWRRWKELLGNANREVQVSAVLGELYFYRYLLKQGIKPEWTGAAHKRIDFVLPDKSYEVKTSISHEEARITIHGCNQLQHVSDSPVYLIFCRLEANEQGEDINTLSEELVSLGINERELETSLAGLGLKTGSVGRKEKYLLLEMRQYLVDENFPLLSVDSFKNGKLPEGIVSIDYTVELANLKYEVILN